MWNFSWQERRWDGAGYENWDKILDEVTERGYNAVCIDAYPHLAFSTGFNSYYEFTNCLEPSEENK